MFGSGFQGSKVPAFQGSNLGTVEPRNLGTLEGDTVQRPAARPRGSEFTFARLRYDSGDWDYNPKVAANVLNSIVEYTNIRVYPEEVVITADSEELTAFPFLFMTGHKLVRFSTKERERLRQYVDLGGFLFSDDCNHDIAGLYAVSFEQEMRTIFPGPRTLDKLARSHALYSAFFHFPEGPPQTAHELNGWATISSTITFAPLNIAVVLACCIPTRITVASGTTTGATSVFSGKITPVSRSISWSTRCPA